jgi:autotransporter-associated beta strand protein
MKTKSQLFRIDQLLLAALALLVAPHVQAQTVRTWQNTGGSTAWYTSTNWNPNATSSGWSTTDTALFENAGSATTAGINMGTASLSISAIHVDSTRSRALTIGNSSGTVGTLTLNGTTVNSISNVILRNASTNLLTLQNNETGTGKTMNIALGNSTNNIISVDGTGGITIGSVIQGAGRNLTISGTNTGTVTLSGNNTFGGVLTVAKGKLTVSSVNNALQNGVLGNSSNAVVLGASGQTGFLHYVGNTNASTDKTFTAATGGTAGIEASNAATTLTLSGAIGGAGNVQKGGAGTLLLAGNNTFTGALNVHDGTLEIASINNNSANGTLGNSTNPVSLGKSGTANVSTLLYTGGTASTTKGFTMASDATAGVINVANSGTTLTVSGQIAGSSGSGLTKTGIGRLSLSGSSSYNGATTVSAGELNLSGGSITNSAVTVASGASLSGYGSVGTIGGAGAINPGNSPGILTTPQVNPSGGTDFNFEMTGIAPNYSDAANSVNDLIQITGSTPFSQALAAGNGFNIYFSGAALFTGSTAVQYQGGFFTDRSASFASSISGATYNYYFANGAGSTTYNGVNYYTRNEYESLVLGTNMLITVTTVAQTANFGSGDINGQVMQVQVIPEPSTYALLGLSAAAFGAYRWRRRHRG